MQCSNVLKSHWSTSVQYGLQYTAHARRTVVVDVDVSRLSSFNENDAPTLIFLTVSGSVHVQIRSANDNRNLIIIPSSLALNNAT